MPLRAIAYSSEVLPGLPHDRIEALTHDAAEFNLIAGVTGLLVFDGARFLQYFEGPDDGVTAAYSRITASSSHMNLVELGRALIGRRLFPYWSMRMLQADPQQLRNAIGNDWTTFVMRSGSHGGALYGVEALARLAAPHVSPVP